MTKHSDEDSLGMIDVLRFVARTKLKLDILRKGKRRDDSDIALFDSFFFHVTNKIRSK